MSVISSFEESNNEKKESGMN